MVLTPLVPPLMRSWIRTLKSMFDGLIYALLTASVFGWLWPR
jgi:hypothetical protein